MLCPSTAGCSPPSMPSIVLSLLLSCFTFHLCFVHPLQDVALHQCLPLSSLCCFPVPGGSLLAMSSCHLPLGSPLDLFALLGCHSPHRLVHLLSFILSICPSHLHFCLGVYSTLLIVFCSLIAEHGLLPCSFGFNTFLPIAL